MNGNTSDPAPRSYPPSVSFVRRTRTSAFATTGDAITFAAIESWLLEEASSERQMIDLLAKLIRRMKAAGSPVDRLTLHIGTLHPQLAGFAWVWNADDDFCDEVRVADAAIDSDAYRLNPLQRIVDTGETIRRAPKEPAAQVEFPIMIELASAGMTDYVAIPLSGLDTRNVITVATKKSGGFTEDEIASMTKLFKLFALHVQRHSESKISENALGAYLGSGAAAKVLDGAIKRGAGDSIRAVIWVSDLRNFTAISDALPPEDTLVLLNAYFEAMASAVAAHGGEILKFIGDGLLAVFPVTAGIAHASRSAVLAAEEAAARLAAFNLAVTVPVSRPELRAAIVLHEGEVFFGNIGAPERLDFTVIGAAVNEACRVEALTKVLGREFLMTEAVARHLHRGTEHLGEHQLRGVSARVAVYGLAA
ncbi:adenylate/guanylate cyclase domain-containing protein [Bradyrhizobium barranii]|uniref:Adenylate/guanylate cyclase domain-containing protein n=1 Tax=Bradyrhizobium barranii TaxID=2992140 RepID=A0ABY3QX55_9BRAD|nr:adenylate/guanylate cyclase domain-containing protein [Bradyrhizobium japonicum]UFW90588.1 adenylate/guanylate cyclase domain-containing protein [Bradyrhizobium japonicum]